MKKLSKILFLVTILIFTFSISSHATGDEIYTITDKTYNIKLEANTGVIPDNAILSVESITEGEVFETIKTALEDTNFVAFDITLLSDEQAVQPTSSVKLFIPIPDEYDKTNLVAYEINSDGTKTEYTVTVEENYAVIEVEDFSYYVLAEKTATTDDNPEQKPGDNQDEEPKDDPNDTGTFTSVDSESKIKIDAPAGVVANDTTIKVTTVIEGERFETIKIILGDVKFKIFDITLLSNGQAVQPNGNVKISIPIPTGYDRDSLTAYRIDSDGTKTEYAVKVEGDYAVIETNHFSDYVLAEKATPTNTEPTDTTDDTTVPTTTDDKQLDNEPKTGINNPVSFVVTVLVIACLGLAICIKKISK